MRRAAILSVFVGCAGLLAVLTPTSSSLPAGDLWTWVQTDPERALLAVINVGAWLVAAWLLLVTGLSLLSGARGVTGRMASRLARMITPIALRRVLEASLGVALAVGPAGAAVAGPSPSATSTVGVTLNALTPPPAPIVAPAQLQVPDLDRPGMVAVTPQPSATVKPLAPKASAPKPTAPTPSASPTAPTPTTPIPSASPTQPIARTHTVLAGDTLWGIAAAELPTSATPAEITLGWQQWYQENQTLIGSDPALIVPGQTLVDHQPLR